MTILNFTDYNRNHFDDCLALFDLNCPKYFAPNERADYEAYLKTTDDNYKVTYSHDELAAAFGMGINEQNNHAYITWIMVSPNTHGQGVGAQMMNTAIDFAKSKNAVVIDIAASHLSAPFFAKFGAKTVQTTKNGWGEGMHRVDMAIPLTK